MTTSSAYEVVVAKTRSEALTKCLVFPGQKAEVSSVRAFPNNDGTWTIIPKLRIIEERPKPPPEKGSSGECELAD